MAHTHAHDHGHAHDHAPSAPAGERAFAVGVALNVAFVAAEAGAGFLAGSVALLADAAHNLSDVLALAAAWGASRLARRAPSPRYTYGLRGSTIWAALFNALSLMLITGALAWEAIERLAAPPPVAAPVVIAVAAIGIAVNGGTALLFAAGRARDLNRRAAFQHMVADAAISLGVVVAGIAILATGWQAIDPLASLAVGAAIVCGTWGLLRESASLALDGVPAAIDPRAVRAYLAGLDGVGDVHDLHIWSLSTTEVALTCHVVRPAGHPGDAALAAIARGLRERFAIHHATIQVETGDPAHPCALAPDNVV